MSRRRPEPSLADDVRSNVCGLPGRSTLPSRIAPPRPGVDLPSPSGDRPATEVDVGASSFTAAELASLNLKKLPARREHISRRATKEGWKSIERGGKGGGRAFAFDALPADVQGELLQRRMMIAAAKNAGTLDKPRAPLPAIAAMSSRQATRHSARTVVLELFASVKGERSDRAALDGFIAAFNSGSIVVDEWVRRDVRSLSRNTLKRWCAASRAGDDELLAGRYCGGRRGVFAQSEEAADFLIGAHATQPLLGAEDLRELLRTKFPQGLPDAEGILLDVPSVDTIERFLSSWKADAANAAVLLAYTDPDRAKSRNRFAAGDAAQQIERPNQLWQIDASPADVMLSEGRHSIYALIDVATRRLMALVTPTPCTASSLLLIARACMAWGIPETIGTDNGSDFTSAHFRSVLRQIGVHHKIAPPYSPERKPFVERSIGSIQHKFMPLMPGYIGSNVAERTAIRARDAFSKRLGVSDKDVFASVALSGSELQERLAAWIENIHHHRTHRGLDGRTPFMVAQQLLALNPPRYADDAAIGMLLMPPASGGGVRVVGKEGIKVDNVDYWFDRLIPGQRLQVRLDPADAGKVWLYTDTDPLRFVGVGVNPELAGLDRAELAGRMLAEQKAIEREGRAHLRKLSRRADIHSVAERMIGTSMPPTPINDASGAGAHTTPSLDEARRAARHGSEQVVRLADRRRASVAEQQEETADDRYARALGLRERREAGEAIDSALVEWLERYQAGSEFRGLHRLKNRNRR